MKTPTFDYHAPSTLEEVLELLGEYGDEAKVIAGGQSLMPMLAMRLARPAHLVDINSVASLSGISERGHLLAFGATTREREAERSPVVAAQVPVLSEALPLIGHVSIRNRGTIGGSIAHADASGEIPAIAVLTDADIVVASAARGERVIAAGDFFVSHFITNLADDECLVEVRIPTSLPTAGWSFQEVARRPGDFALVGTAAMLTLDPGGAVADARICLIGVADRPQRVRDTEAGLVGAQVSAETFRAAAADSVKGLEPASDMHGSSQYRRHLAGVTVRRALTTAAQRAGGPR
jgi:CO/xanthine dehydrogenase FAD-binding subunit